MPEKTSVDPLFPLMLEELCELPYHHVNIDNNSDKMTHWLQLDTLQFVWVYKSLQKPRNVVLKS